MYFRSVHVDYIYKDDQHIDMFVAHQEALLITLYQVDLQSASYIIMAYGSTPYVEMTPKKMAATLKVHKWHAWTVCIRLVNSLYEPYQALSNASMANKTVNFDGKYR